MSLMRDNTARDVIERPSLGPSEGRLGATRRILGRGERLSLAGQ